MAREDSAANFSEEERLEALQRYQILDTPPEPAFDRMTALAARLFNVPIVLISLVDRDRQWFKSCYGLDASQSDRQASFCTYTIQKDEVLVVPDTWRDPRFARNPFVIGDPHARFYAGAPLRNAQGYALGSLCILDIVPREFSEKERVTLQDLAAYVVAELELRSSEQQLKQDALEREVFQNALSQVEARFRSAFELSPIGMAMVSLEGKWLQVNRRLCDILGYDEQALSALTFQDITHPDDLNADLELVQRMVRGEIETYDLEKRYFHADGSLIWALLSVSLVRDAQGQPLHFISQVQDISARKISEANLGRSESLKTAVLETSLDCIVTIDDQSRIQEWNAAAERTFGFSRAEAMGLPIQNLIVPPELREAHRQGLRRYMASGVSEILGQRLEMPAMRRDGTRITVELAIVAIPYTDPQLFTGQMRDITQRLSTERALRDSESRYSRITSNVPGMVYQFTMDKAENVAFPYVSQGCRELFEVEPAQVMEDATLVLRMMHPDDVGGFMESVGESARGLTSWEWEGRTVMKSGAIKWMRGTARPKAEADVVVWDGLLTDITPRKQQEESLKIATRDAENAREEAERANLAKSEFLGRMSHELRTPLNAILGFGQLLEMSPLSGDDMESVEQIVKGGRHLLDLINEVLDIARIESGHLSLSPEAVEVSDIGLEALDLVRPLAAMRGLIIEDADVRLCRLCVRADRQRLKQVLINLLSNAVKYNRTGGTIDFSVSLVEGEDGTSEMPKVRLAIRDEGSGIAPTLYARIFTPFDRLGAEASGIEGTGVGLALSRRLAQAMGGELSFDSELGRGSTFWLELAQAPHLLSSVETFAASQEVRAELERRTVLYVEDNPANLFLMQRVLAQRPEVRLLTAIQGSIGFEMALLHSPDLILLDMNLPDSNGRDVLMRLRANERTRSIPVIMVSADATPGQIARTLEAGAQHYLTKPYDMRELWNLLDQHLGGQKLASESGTKVQALNSIENSL